MPILLARESVRQRCYRALEPKLKLVLTLLVVAVSGACGIERDGSHKQVVVASVDASSDSLGRYQTESVRLGVSRPLFLLIDTATGRVYRRNILGAQKFQPVSDEPAPGDDLEPQRVGRYDVKVVPGRRGSALLRLDTVTGKTWFLQLSPAQREWYAIPSSLEDEIPARVSGGATSLTPHKASGDGGVASTSKEPKKPPIKALLEVLIDRTYDTQLRIWTAGHMAGIYPVEAAQLAGTELADDDPRILLAVIDEVAFDPDGQVRAALVALQGHADERVAAALEARLGASAP